MEGKYFDHRRNRAIDASVDGCPLEMWKSDPQDHSFGWHQDGFKVFLPSDRLITDDEYAESDPYRVSENLTSPFQQRRRELTLEMLGDASRHGTVERILDLGCGEGHITGAILDEFPDTELTGLDYSVSAVARAHKLYSDVDFLVADAYEVPIGNGYFDMVVCNNLWEHVPDPLRLLAEIGRVLRNNGFIALSTPSRYRLRNLVRVLLGRPINFMSHLHVTEYSVGQVSEQLAYGGFHLLRKPSRKMAEGVIVGLSKMAVSGWVQLVKSHHELEATAFFLAQRGNSG